MSPIILNVVLDYLIRELEVAGLGVALRGARMPVLALADDLVLMGESPAELQGALNIALDFFLDRVGMLWVYVLHLLSQEQGEDLGAAAVWCVGWGGAARELAVDEPFRYLGAAFTVHKDLDDEMLAGEVRDAVARCARLSLKPMQKLDLLCKFVLPGYYYRLVADRPGVVKLGELNIFVRTRCLEMLHLPLSVSSHFVHCRMVAWGYRG